MGKSFVRSGCLAFLAGLFSVLAVYAQEQNLIFDSISIEDGLSNSRVNTILQDREGFMWFGTNGGLNKYDGYGFTVFGTDPRKSRGTFQNDVIWAMLEDRKGRLWASTLGDGLHQIDKKTYALTSFRVDSVARYKNLFYSIYEESDSVLWVGTHLGLVRINRLTKELKSFEFPAPNDYTSIFCIADDAAGRLWVGTKMGLYSFDRRTGTYALLPLTSAKGQGQPLVSALYRDPSGLLWVGTNGEALFKLGATGEGLFRVDTRQPDLPRSAYNPRGLINKNIALNGIVNYAGAIWLATDQGLQRIQLATDQVTTYQANPQSSNGLSSNNILCFYPDRDGNLWIGTDNGVNKVVRKTKHFRSYQLRPVPKLVHVVDNEISSLLQDPAGRIYLGNNLKGLFRFDTRTGKATHVPASRANPSALYSDQVWCIFQDRHRQIWVGTLEGLHRLDPQTGNVTRFACRLAVQYIAEAPDGTLWVGGKNGLAAFNPITQQFRYPVPREVSFNFISALMVSRTGDVWLAQQGSGIQRFNPQTGQQTFYMANLQKPGQLNDADVNAIYEDPQGMVWVATARGGLNFFNPKTATFASLTTHEGLPSNSIASILEDKNGLMWLGTARGLVRFNRKTRTFRTYTTKDGLPEIQFYPGSAARNGSKLLLGTINGFTVFDCDSIRDNTHVPPVYLTELKVRDQPRSLANRLELPYSQNFLSFEFVALDYVAPEENRYAYRLEGIDERWVNSGSRRFVSYADLAPGTYVFRVRAANNDGVWNNRGAAVTIVVNAPWWRTWWAYGLYALLLAGIVWALIAYRSWSLYRKNRLLEEKVHLRTQQVLQQRDEIVAQKEEIEAQRDNLEQTLDELKSTQSQLIQREKMASLGELTAGVAHEIQNPLNFVNNFSRLSVELVEELKEERETGNEEVVGELLDAIEQNLAKINEHGRRADGIVKGMLQHSRTSSGEKDWTDLNDLIEEYLKLSYHGVRTKDKAFMAELVLDFDRSLGKVRVAPQDLGRVLLNLFNNAFYAVRQKQKQALLAAGNPEGETAYHPVVAVHTRAGEGTVDIRVVDNGTGIPADLVQKIFQPFFTTKPTGEGTGLGLSLSYDIVTQLHGGTFDVRSEAGQGTEMIIHLPTETA